MPPAAKIHGYCDPEFSLVQEVFAEHFEAGKELGGAIAVTLDGRSVVDLWGGYADPEARVGFGYVMNLTGSSILINERPAALIEALYECL